jgi:hypothetical protein
VHQVGFYYKDLYAFMVPFYHLCVGSHCLLTFILNFYTVRLESHCACRLWYVDLVVSIEVAVEVCCCFTVFSC